MRRGSAEDDPAADWPKLLDEILRKHGLPTPAEIHQAAHSVALSYLYWPSVALVAAIPPERRRARGRPPSRTGKCIPWPARSPHPWQNVIHPLSDHRVPREAQHRRFRMPARPGGTLWDAYEDAAQDYALPEESWCQEFDEESVLERDAHVRAATIVAHAGATAERLILDVEPAPEAVADDERRLTAWAAEGRLTDSPALAGASWRTHDFVARYRQDILRCAVALRGPDEMPVPEWCGPRHACTMQIIDRSSDASKIGAALAVADSKITIALAAWVLKRRALGPNTLSAMYSRLVLAGVPISRANWFRLVRQERTATAEQAQRIMEALHATIDEIATVLKPQS